MEALETALRKIEELKGDLSAEIVVQEEEGHYHTGSYHRDGDEGGFYVVDKFRETIPDTKKRESARNELKSIATSFNKSQIVKYAASRTLGEKTNSKFGYYPLRIWAHEHPVAATVTGIVAVGITSGLVYALVEYLNR